MDEGRLPKSGGDSIAFLSLEDRTACRTAGPLLSQSNLTTDHTDRHRFQVPESPGLMHLCQSV